MVAPPKRRWYQFSLKTLLVATTLFCIGPGGYVAYEQRKARKQKAAVEAIEKLGGKVEYHLSVPARSAMMRQIFGDESFGNVRSVIFDGTQVTDAGIAHLACLTKLEELRLYDTQVTDAGLVHLVGLKGLATLSLSDAKVTDAGLVHLAGLTKLEQLYFDSTQVTDAGLVHLAELKGLAKLSLSSTEVTDAGVAELQKALPNCKTIR